MMKFNTKEIIDSYVKYGFVYKDLYSTESFLTFTIKQGFFHNAEILILDDKCEISSELDEVRKELNQLDISAKTFNFENIDKVKTKLFNGFFDVDSWRDRVRLEYSDYIEGVLRTVNIGDEEAKYKYVDSPYEIVTEDKVNSVDKSIVDSIFDKLKSDAAELILVEAPAGFGKTSTSFEIVKKIIDDDLGPMPFFTEFSRDRHARIFSHVFIREVDRAFSNVNSNVVQDEVKNGRVILILDGFDELLTETNDKKISEEDYENAEPMLQTISDLLVGKAKIIITSRRSAIFDGAIFNEWLDQYSGQFSFSRYRISSPEINNWLNYERYSSLERSGIDISKLSNPVLLAYLRFLSDSDFEAQCERPYDIINKYFKAMLERERIRQNLTLTSDEQSEILTKLASDMCEKNYTSESKDKIIRFLKSNCLNVLNESITRYINNKPTVDLLCSTLSNHAFFDRSSQGDDRIEFINEFVFGNFIANDILKNGRGWIAYDERFVEPAIISYEARTAEERLNLWRSLETMSEFLKDSDRMNFEAKMLGDFLSDSYSEKSIMSIRLNHVEVFRNISVHDITFSDCVFDSVTFDFDNISSCTFISCRFFDCNYLGGKGKDSLLFLNCNDNNNFINELTNDAAAEEKYSEVYSELTKDILSRFWKVGADSIERAHVNLATIYKYLQHKGHSKRDITKNIQELKKRRILMDAEDKQFIAINTQEIALVTRILGK